MSVEQTPSSTRCIWDVHVVLSCGLNFQQIPTSRIRLVCSQMNSGCDKLVNLLCPPMGVLRSDDVAKLVRKRKAVMTTHNGEREQPNLSDHCLEAPSKLKDWSPLRRARSRMATICPYVVTQTIGLYVYSRRVGSNTWLAFRHVVSSHKRAVSRSSCSHKADIFKGDIVRP